MQSRDQVHVWIHFFYFWVCKFELFNGLSKQSLTYLKGQEVVYKRE